jgi:hypothetical protein
VVAAEQHRGLRIELAEQVILGLPSARRIVTSAEPGSRLVPTARNQAGPRRAISAR